MISWSATRLLIIIPFLRWFYFGAGTRHTRRRLRCLVRIPLSLDMFGRVNWSSPKGTQFGKYRRSPLFRRLRTTWHWTLRDVVWRFAGSLSFFATFLLTSSFSGQLCTWNLEHDGALYCRGCGERVLKSEICQRYLSQVDWGASGLISAPLERSTILLSYLEYIHKAELNSYLEISTCALLRNGPYSIALILIDCHVSDRDCRGLKLEHTPATWEQAFLLTPATTQYDTVGFRVLKQWKSSGVQGNEVDGMAYEATRFVQRKF